MSAVEILAGLGFEQAQQTGEARGKTIVRIRTSKGWVYEKFDSAGLEQSIARWAGGHQP